MASGTGGRSGPIAASIHGPLSTWDIRNKAMEPTEGKKKPHPRMAEKTSRACISEPPWPRLLDMPNTLHYHLVSLLRFLPLMINGMSSTAAASAGSVPTRIKLRASCDRCSSNKIKCSQDKPQCIRCRQLNLPCNYSRSLRSGKPPRSRQRKNLARGTLYGQPLVSSYANITLENNRTCPEVHRGSEMAAVIEDAKNFPTGVAEGPAVSTLEPTETIGLDTMFAAAMTQSGVNSYRLYDSGAHGRHLFGTLPSAIDYTSISGPCRDDDAYRLAQINSESKPLPLQPYHVPCLSLSPNYCSKPATATTTALELGYSPPTNCPMVESTHDCIGLALTTLSSLYKLSVANPPPGCSKLDNELPDTPAVHSAGPTIDQVFQVNSAATTSTLTLVSCSCPKDHCFPILMALIFSKILSWYQAIVGIADPMVDSVDESYNSSISSGSSGSMFREEVTIVQRPFFIRGYRLDEEVGRMVINQLVLNELKELADSVRAFFSNLCADNGNGHGSRNGIPASGDAQSANEQVALRMGAVVEARLRLTIQELGLVLASEQQM